MVYRPSGNSGQPEQFPLPHPEGEVYDPEGYRRLVADSSQSGKRFGGLGAVCVVLILGSCATATKAADFNTVAIAVLILLGSVATLIGSVALSIIRDNQYQARLREHQLAVAKSKSAKMGSKSVVNNVTLNFSNGSNFTGPLVVGENISVSYAAIGTASGAALKLALEKLVKTSSAAIEKIPDPGLKLKASEQLKTLTEQAASPKPSKWLLELSSQGLIDAAKTVASMATPVATAVKAVLALIASAA